MAKENTGQALVFGDLVTDVSASQLYVLGTRRDEDGQIYRYVKFDNGAGNVAAAAGALCYRGIASVTNSASLQMWTVTSDVSDVDSAFAAGVFVSVIADAGFGWILTRGNYATVKKQTGSGNAWVKGDCILALPSSTADGKAGRWITTATITTAPVRRLVERQVGFARAAVSTTTASGKAFIELD
jgi:hypothetical protein